MSHNYKQWCNGAMKPAYSAYYSHWQGTRALDRKGGGGLPLKKFELDAAGMWQDSPKEDNLSTKDKRLVPSVDYIGGSTRREVVLF